MSIDIFKVGSRWFDRNGEWEVLQNSGEKIFAQYIDSVDMKFFESKDVKLVKRIHDNIMDEENDERKKLFCIKSTSPNVTLENESDLYFTLGFLARNSRLTIMTRPKIHIRDENRYHEITGKNLDEGSGYYIDTCKTSWQKTTICFNLNEIGLENFDRLYFPENKVGNKLIIKDGRYQYFSSEWGWFLIEKFGFRCHYNHDLDIMKSNIPSKYMSLFEEGYNTIK